ncbi:IS200/IS605 family transposase [Pleurocapsales cyanobacterium LEGE 06147]|nr:IS200/IS605 family transposase [Pleurocapsales cyanobacterium LEGE 06147]
MSFWRLYYHLVWATKERQPLIKADKETELYGYIIGKADYLGCIIHGINGTDNHIHLVASIPPSLSIADFVKKIKGSSSHYWNHNLSAQRTYQVDKICSSVLSSKLYWQEGYGVFSLGSKQLEQVVDYVRNQKIHHSQGTAIASLEKAFEGD